MGGRRILTDEQVDMACEMRERGLSCQRIANRFAAMGVKVSAGSISWACLTQGADLPPARQAALPPVPESCEPVMRGDHIVRRFTRGDDALLRVLDMQAFSVAVIARRMDRKPNSIRGRLATLARHEARSEQSAGNS